MGRRGNGEGSVRQRPDGRWEARVRLPGGVRVSAYGSTRAEATEAAAKLVRDARMGVSALDGRQLYADWLNRWLEIHAQTIEDRTAGSYERAIRLHIAPVVGSVRLCDLAPYHLDRVFARMRAKGLRTFAIVYHVLHASLQAAMRQGYVARNVAELITKPADATKAHEPYTTEQAIRYLAVALDPRYAQPAPKGASNVTPVERHNQPVRLGPMLALTILTGLRLAEVAGLNWRDIELAPKERQNKTQGKPLLRVVNQCYWKHGDPVIKKPKTQSSRRAILLTSQAVEALTHWRKLQREERLRAGPVWVTTITCVSPERRGEQVNVEGLVFTDELGRPLSHHHIRAQHWRICRLAGLPIIRPHDLRHSFATLLLSAGVNPKVVAEMLGHTTVNMTLNRYSHVLPIMQLTAIDDLDHLLSTTSESLESEERDASQ